MTTSTTSDYQNYMPCYQLNGVWVPVSQDQTHMVSIQIVQTCTYSKNANMIALESVNQGMAYLGHKTIFTAAVLAQKFTIG